MTVITGGFWPEEIKPTIQSPLAILSPRADELTEQTRGILVGKVSTTSDVVNKWVFHSLDVYVPALENFRQRLLTVKHLVSQIYPASVDAEVFDDPTYSTVANAFAKIAHQSATMSVGKKASTDEELVALLKKILHSPQIKSTLVSLIAMANQAMAEKEGASIPGPPVDLGTQNTAAENRD